MLARLRRRFGGPPPGSIRVHLLMKGRIGDGWYDVDQHLALPAPATLGECLDEAERQGIRVRAALADSPHLAHTLMLNGERCPVDENADRLLADGDQLYLLSPLAGG